MQFLSSRHSEAVARPVAGARFLDHLDSHDLCSNLTVFNPTPEEIARLIERARADMPLLATTEVIQAVAARNPDCFWAIQRSRGSKTRNPSGFVAFLMLSKAGREALLSGRLNAGDPSPAFIAGQHESPSAIYVWALHAKGMLTPALSLVIDKLQSPNYARAEFIARAATDNGRNFLTALGFVERRSASGLPFFFYQRREPVRDNQANRPATHAKLVNSFEEFSQVLSVRAAVYVGEEHCPLAEEFDGNDFSATHVIGYVGPEPAGSLRIRYFAGFAKLERLAVRPQYRGLGLAREIVSYGTDLCRCKGYQTLYIHARTTVVDFWNRFGFELIHTSDFRFSDYSYTEMTATLPPHPSPISLGLDPHVLNRPEGRWDSPGILEQSGNRFPGPQNAGYRAGAAVR